MSIERPIGGGTHVQQETKHSAKKGQEPHKCPSSALVIAASGKAEPRIDSRMIAENLGVQHKAVMQLLDRYAERFKTFGQLPFKKEVGARVQGGGNPERFALLNEDQAFFLLSLSRNTAPVVELKARLVQAFREARQARELTNEEYLPTYRLLHDEIATLAAGASNERFVHINMNRLLNATVGCAPGNRGNLPLPAKAMLVAAQVVAINALQPAVDHRDGYRRAKDALDQLGMLAVGAPTCLTVASRSRSRGFVSLPLVACLPLFASVLALLGRRLCGA